MLRELTLSANVSAPRMIGFPAPAQLNVIVLHAVRSPLISLKVKDVAKAADMHGVLSDFLAVFLISLVIRSMPILPLWVMPSLVVASNQPRAPCKSGIAIIAATIPSRVITIIISMRVKPLLLFISLFFYPRRGGACPLPQWGTTKGPPTDFSEVVHTLPQN